MIDYLKGILVDVNQLENKIILEVDGIGYSINISSGTFYLLQNNLKKIITIYISETNSMYSGTNTFYGFLSKNERELFQIIKNVNKIGAKGALDILSRIGDKVNDFRFCIANNSIEKLHEIFGFTESKAEKLILGLKNKIPNIESDVNNVEIKNFENSNNFINNDNQKYKNDAIEALKTLGYNAIKAKKIITDIFTEYKILDTEILSLEEIIKIALKKM
ncbi:MAG: Holliday junction branch migration protein RuvA [Elusimicrobiota bacterium]|jgi:Holliday junction DNA helicase RuvA|nr:Holliday junction branch migration protein RuvA [Elusimicrobiota bacterium]